MYLLLLNVYGIDPEIKYSREIILGFVKWISQHQQRLTEEASIGNIEL